MVWGRTPWPDEDLNSEMEESHEEFRIRCALQPPNRTTNDVTGH